MERKIAEVALEIRGTLSALEAYLKAKRYDLVIGQINRGRLLKNELCNYNDKLSFVNFKWKRIAQTEIKDLQAKIEIALSQIPVPQQLNP